MRSTGRPDAGPAVGRERDPGPCGPVTRADPGPAPAGESCPPPAFEPPALRRWPVHGGGDLHLARDGRLPEVSVRMIFEAGAMAEPPASSGVAELTARVLAGRGADLGRREAAVRLDRLGGHLGIAVRHDAVVLSVHSLSDVVDRTLDLLRNVVREPAMARDAVDRTADELARELDRGAHHPGAAADHTLLRALYGDHRYGSPAVGEAEVVRRLEHRDVVTHHRRCYAAGSTTAVACGDLHPLRFRDAFASRFGDRVTRARRAPPAAPPTKAVAAGRVLVVHRPESAQAHVRLGAVGPAPGDDAYVAVRVGNVILGGEFDSRLDQVLRQERGWTYGARSYVRDRRGPGPVVVATAVEPGAAGAALAVVRDEIRAMWERPADEDELARARDHMIRSLPRRFETVRQVTARTASRVVRGLPGDWWPRYPERVRAVDAGAVARAMRANLAPERLAAVVVADAGTVVPDLEKRFGRVDVLAGRA